MDIEIFILQRIVSEASISQDNPTNRKLILQPSNDFCNGRSNLLRLPLQAPENWDEYVAHSTTSASTSSWELGRVRRAL